MTDIVDRLREYAECCQIAGMTTEMNRTTAAITEISRLRGALERVLLDIKFMEEEGLVSPHFLDDIIYQNALELMTPEFLKEFYSEKEKST